MSFLSTYLLNIVNIYQNMYIKSRHYILLQIKYLFNTKNIHVISFFVTKLVGAVALPIPKKLRPLVPKGHAYGACVWQ